VCCFLGAAECLLVCCCLVGKRVDSRLTYSTNRKALCAALPEALAHSPSQMPLGCPVATPSQRELRKNGGGGGGVARTARAARAPEGQVLRVAKG